MSLFRNKKVFTLVKKSRLKKHGWETWYHTEIDGNFVPNSMFVEKESAEEFFDRLIIHKGEYINTTILKSRKI